jgi:hypothetical protein
MSTATDSPGERIIIRARVGRWRPDGKAAVHIRNVWKDGNGDPIPGYELFWPEAFHSAQVKGKPLLRDHDPLRRVGTVLSITRDDDGWLYMRAALDHTTTAGGAALGLVELGQLAASMQFHTVGTKVWDHSDPLMVEHRTCRLLEVSLAPVADALYGEHAVAVVDERTPLLGPRGAAEFASRVRAETGMPRAGGAATLTRTPGTGRTTAPIGHVISVRG